MRTAAPALRIACHVNDAQWQSYRGGAGCMRSARSRQNTTERRRHKPGHCVRVQLAEDVVPTLVSLLSIQGLRRCIALRMHGLHHQGRLPSVELAKAIGRRHRRALLVLRGAVRAIHKSCAMLAWRVRDKVRRSAKVRGRQLDSL